jgi:sugar (pentulose or hexulose) kinase
MHADVLNRRMKQVCDPKEAGAKGAAIIAAVALGHIKRFKDAEKLVRIDEVFEPNLENVKLYAGIFKEFKNIYKSNCKMCRRLNAGKCL